MTDSELNALVAEKVMGREVYQGEFPYDKPVLVVPGSWGFVEGYGSQPEVEDCPDYCNDIAAAWLIVEHRGTGWIIYKNYNTVEIYDSVHNLDEGIMLEGDASPARAICLAALKVAGFEVMGEDE